MIILEGLSLLYAGVFQGHRLSCRVELCRTRLNFAAHPSGDGTDSCVFFLFSSIFFCHFGISVQKRFPGSGTCSAAHSHLPSDAREAALTWPIFPRQMLRALRVDESLREQLETKSDIHPLSLCCCSGKNHGMRCEPTHLIPS